MRLRPPLLVARLDDRAPFALGLLLLVVFLSLGAYHVLTLELAAPGTRVHYLTVVGHLLPDRMLESRSWFLAAQAVFLVSALFWLIHLALPLSSWLAVLSFTVVVSMFLESQYYTRHMFHSVNDVLLILAAWYQGRHRELRTAFRRREWSAALCPSWVMELGIVWAVVTYTYSGWAKVMTAQTGWASGTALQLWAFEWGIPGFAKTVLVEHRWVAAALQTSVLLAETTCFVCLWSAVLRPIYGLVFLAFHAGTVLVFGYDFYGNIALAVLGFVAAPVWTRVARAAR